MKYFLRNVHTLLWLLLLLSIFSCTDKQNGKITRSFYYWKTVVNISPQEKVILKELSVNSLYIKFFDVEWNSQQQTSVPVAKSIFRNLPRNLSITPVVFITQEPLKKSDTATLRILAYRITALVSNMIAGDTLNVSNEIQFDCDWTASTKEKFFFLLNCIKEQPLLKGRILSATIRLHQLKYRFETGVPPVDKGLLMCYNMGNLRNPQTKNSIIETEELKKYVGSIPGYPLPLDVALPIFDWWVLFDEKEYKGLVRDFEPSGTEVVNGRYFFKKDTVIQGTQFRKGQWLRHETSEANVVIKSAEMINEKLNNKNLNVILYHLDEKNLKKYNRHELEIFFNSFH